MNYLKECPRCGKPMSKQFINTHTGAVLWKCRNPDCGHRELVYAKKTNDK